MLSRLCARHFPLKALLALAILAASGSRARSQHTGHQRGFLQKPEAVQADLPAEAVPQLLDETTGTELAAKKQTRSSVLNVCILSADFWGLKAAGGTATAYHLLAASLAKDESLNVTFLQTTKRVRVCQEARELNKHPGLTFACLSKRHFSPEVAESLPYSAVSQAVVAWIMEEPGRCDVVHAHEWGGVFADLVTLNHFRDLQPGLRIAIEPHGGHVWSQLGEMNRPMDVYALRIDSSERATNALNDIEISPTKYMLAYLRQRGWTLPPSTLVIPNIVPEAEKHALASVTQKKVWRIAFFGRLEERKGLKLFVEAVNKLQEEYNILELNSFEIHIVGPEAIIDMVPSKQWLKVQTADWKFKTHLAINVPRDEALEIISQQGMLLVLCSFIDNMPYVVAEAATKAIPFLVFDAGGVLELFDHTNFSANVVRQATPAALASRLNEVLTEGSLSTVKLAREVTTGLDQWLQFHTDFASNQSRFNIAEIIIILKEDLKLVEKAKKSSRPVQVVDIKKIQFSLDLWEGQCLGEDSQSDDVLLLLPDGYTIPRKEDTLKEVAELISIAEARDSPVHALTFGVDLPNKKVSFPSAPTWMLYAGDHQHCMDDIPVALKRNTFCNAFLGHARVFEHYNAWILALLLDHANMMMYPYPKAFFKAAEYNLAGTANCALDKFPQKRAKEYTTAASRLFRDSAAMMHGMVLAHAQKPLASLLDDASSGQLHKGWQYGYLDGFANQTRQLHPLVWEAGEDNEFGEDIWGCGTKDKNTLDYPHFKRNLLHPCHNNEGLCCNGTVHAPFILRLNSFLHADSAAVQITYDAFALCGDGFDFKVTHYPADPSRQPTELINAPYDPVSKTSKPRRQTLEALIDMRPGDEIDFVVEPRHNHDCDGLYIVEAKVWPPTEEQVKKRALHRIT